MDDAVVGARARPRFPYVNVVLFLATLASTTIAGAQLASTEAEVLRLATAPVLHVVAFVAQRGLPFAAALLGILLSHEMGHYLMARKHRVDATLPYFLPLPFVSVGTLGAIIRLRSAFPDRRATLEIGAAGPIAGVVVAVPLLLWGLAHSTVARVPALTPAFVDSPLGLLRQLLSGHPLSQPVTGWMYGDSLLTWGASRLLYGQLPAGTELMIHPVGLAAWIGLFITALNLLPVGQLDGGHVLYAALGHRRALAVSRAVNWALLGCGLMVSWVWLVWWAVTRFYTGLGHPPALREDPPGRWPQVVAIVALVLFLLTFIPVPVTPIA
ncbi:MAG: site-2 protease family protein [Anaeromyxobacter sp.]